MKKHLKLLVMLLLIITPTIFSACNRSYKNIEIVASSLGGEHAVSMFVGEEKEITFNVYKLPKNASGRLSFSKDSSAITQPEIVSYTQENHKTVIKFTAEMHGRVELKAIAEGNQFITVVINIKERIASFELKQELVLVEGDHTRSQIELTSKLFNFYPKETEQTQLEFLNQDNEIITNISLEDYPNLTEIVIKARSLYLDYTKDVVIKVVNKIDPFKFYIIGENQAKTELISKEEKTDESQASTIYLSANKKQEYSFVNLQAVIDGDNDLYGADFVFNASSKVLIRHDKKMREFDTDSNQTMFNFVVSVGGFDTGEDEIEFEAFYTNIDKKVYKITRTFKVVVIEYPNKVFVNNMDSQSLEPIILHVGHHKEITTNVNVNIYPLNAKIDSIEVEYNTSNLGGQADISQYIEFRQSGKQIDHTLNLSLPIVAKGIKNTDGKEVYLILKINYGSEFGLSQSYQEVIEIPFEVKAGASQLFVEDTWQSGEIYVSLNKGNVPAPFKGLYVTEMAAYLDEVEAKPLFVQAAQIVRVEPQEEIVNEDETRKFLPLNIYPLAAGEAFYNILLANGVSKQIKIVVLPEISTFKVNYVAADSSPVTAAKYENQSLKELSMQIEKQENQNIIKTKFEFSTDIENYLSKYSDYYDFIVDTDPSGNIEVDYDKNLPQTLTVKKLSNNGLSNRDLITFKLSLHKIENFKMVRSSNESGEGEQGVDFEHTITYNAFLPLSSISFSKKHLSLFNESELGIYYKKEASDETKLEFFPSDIGEIFKNIIPGDNSNPNRKLEYSVSNTNSFYDKEAKTLKIGEMDEVGNPSIGKYNVDTGIFTLDNKSANLENFEIIAKVTYYEKVFVATVKVEPKEYIRPSSIQFSDYVSGIYLDPTRPRAEINMFILPNNATHKVIEYDVEAPPAFNSAALNVQIVNNTKLIVTFNPNISLVGEATADIVLKPRAAIDNAAITPTNSRRINVKIGLGTSENPYRIYTPEQLLNISAVGLDKHYRIVNRIDLSHITDFKSIGKFTGSLEGDNISSEISGIKITNTTSGNAGLFTSIAPQKNAQGVIVANTGVIRNLKISGALDITLSNASSVGLVAGVLEAGAVLENVTVTLLTSNVRIDTTEEINVGGVVGANNGTIQTIITNEDKSRSSLLVGLGRMTISFIEKTGGAKGFIGGIVGVNKEGALIQRVIRGENVELYNAGNYFASLDMVLTADYPGTTLTFSIGLMAGKNNAIIKSVKESDENRDIDDYIKLGGKIIVETQSDNKVGGIVGENTIAEEETLLDGIASRVKMISYGSGSNSSYFGGAFGINNGGIVKNIVLQAVEDGTSVGFDASMLFSNEFGSTVETKNRVGIFGYSNTLITPSQIEIESDFAQDNNLQAQTFVGAEDNENVPSSRRKFVARGSTATLTNYYGDFVVGRSRPTHTDTEEIDETEEKRTAIKFTAAEISFLIDEENIINRLNSSSSSKLMAYLELYVAKDAGNQHIIDRERLNKYAFPFKTMGEISLFSLNSNIVSILNDGTLKVNNTGVAQIQVYSMLNRRVVRTVYIMVTHSFDSYTLYLNNKIEGAFNADGNHNIEVGAKSAVSLLPVVRSSRELGGFIVDFVPSTNLLFKNIESYSEDFTQTVVFEKVGGSYILRAVNQPGITNFKIEARVFYVFDGEEFVAKNPALQFDPKAKNISFSANYYVGATKVSLSSSSLEIEPLEKTDIILEIETDKFDDDVEIKEYKTSFDNEVESFNIKEKNRNYNISVNKSINEIKEIESFEGSILKAELKISQKSETTEKTKNIDVYIDLNNLTLSLTPSSFQPDIWLDMSEWFYIDYNLTYTYDFKAFTSSDTESTEVAITSLFKLNKIQKLLSIEFKEEKIDIDNEYVGNYIIEFVVTSSDELASVIGTGLSVQINAQTIGIVSVVSFEGSQEGEIASGNPEYNYVDPMAKNKNHFRVSMFPLQADYDYLRIETGNNPNTSNQINAIFSLIDKSGKTISGAKNVANGLIVDKGLINSDIYIRYSVEMLNLYNEDNVPFIITVYKNNQVIYTLNKTVKVKYRQDVSINIVGKEEVDEIIYVTRGSTYNFNLTANGYRDSEVVIQALTPNIVTASISARTLTISSNINAYPTDNLKVRLQIFGRKTVNGEVIESSPQELTLVVLEYLILHSEEYIPVKRAFNKIATVSIGDTLVLEAEFILGQTVEYEPSITSIPNTIKAFENTITEKGTWKYQMGVLNNNGEYEYTEQGWITIREEVGTSLTDGYFTITKNKDNKFVFTPHKVLDGNNPPYKFNFEYGYDYKEGKAVFMEGKQVTQSEFLVNVYQMSAIDSPTPIYTAAQLETLNPGAYYILMNDIAITSNFSPISTAFGGLDGNNKKIIINSNIVFEEQREFTGLFTTISKDTLVRNLIIEVGNITITVSKQNTQSTYFGLLAGQNNEMITNVSVKSLPNTNLRVDFVESVPQISSLNYASLLVGHNSSTGFITHSRVEANIYSASSLSGFVAYNRGKVSNSYVNNALIVNTSGRLEDKTAGFVVVNAGQDGEGGQIFASYVSGVSTGNTIYANSLNKVIQSSREVGGFVYENNGYISNSYSNIPILASSNSAGFVYTNYGTIENTYSSSLLKETSEGTYGYIKTNYGILKNNYFLEDSDAGVNDRINASNRYTEGSSTNAYQKTELLQLKIADFNKEGSFMSFVFTPIGSLTKGVWFHPRITKESQFNNPTKNFSVGRPELVSANLLATSEMEIDLERTVENTQTGEVDYAYKNVGEFYQGSTHNPIIVTSAQDLENRVLQSSSGNVNMNSFRILKDLDYGQDTTSSNLYKTIFVGDIEGNGMEISNYIVNISSSMASAGLFSKIGLGSSGQGTVKNLVLKPAYINLPNTNSVGALAGTIEGATLFNINVDGESASTSNVMIIGKNLVGGLFGRATGRYSLKNIKGNISVSATFRSSVSLNPTLARSGEAIGSYFLFRTHTAEVLSKLSYSGAVGGVLSGEGLVSHITVEGNIVSNSEWAALMFGGVGNGVLLENSNVLLNQQQIVQASAYGAVVAAEFYGRMENVTANASSDVLTTDLFKTLTYKPYGLGGIVGLLGTAENLSDSYPTNAYSGKAGLYNVKAGLEINAPNIETVGGIASRMIGGNIENALFNGTINSKAIAGGIVGKISPTISYQSGDAPIGLLGRTLIEGSTSPVLSELEVDGRNGVNSGIIRVENDNEINSRVGGVVGDIEGEAKITYATVKSQLRASSISFGAEFEGVYVGGIVGKFENKDESKNLTLKHLKFESRIVISLRNLNYANLKDDDFSGNKIGYGYIVGKIKEEDIISSSESLQYKTSAIRYVGEVSDGSHYLLFAYIKNGQTHHYNQEEESNKEKWAFIQEEIEGEIEI